MTVASPARIGELFTDAGSGVGRKPGPLGMDEFVNKRLLYIAG